MDTDNGHFDFGSFSSMTAFFLKPSAFRAVLKSEDLACAVVPCNVLAHALKDSYVVTFKLLVCPSDYKDLDTWIIAGKHDSLCSYCPGLASTTCSGSTISYEFLSCVEEQYLFAIRSW